MCLKILINNSMNLIRINVNTSVMKIDDQTRKQLIRNVLLSLFIYALPVALMFLSFYISGSRPWQKKAVMVHHSVKH